MRIPGFWIGEVFLRASGCAGGGEEDVRWGDSVRGSRDGEVRFCLSHDGVDREVDAEGFLDDVLV